MNNLMIEEIGLNTTDDGFANLFGGCWPRCEKKWKEENTQQALLNVDVLPAGASCKQIDLQIEKIQNEINSINNKIASGDKSKRWNSALSALSERMKEAKNARSAKNCQDILEKQQKKEEITQFSQVAEQTAKSATTVDKEQELRDQIEAARKKRPDYTKYIAIGIGGIFVVAAVVILLKPKK